MGTINHPPHPARLKDAGGEKKIRRKTQMFQRRTEFRRGGRLEQGGGSEITGMWMKRNCISKQRKNHQPNL